MDPLSVTGTLIAVLQITAKIISICYDYRQGVGSASRDAIRISDELSSLKDVLDGILRLVEQSAKNEESQSLSTIILLAQPGGSFESCLAELERLRKKLEPESGWRKVRSALTWPLKETEVKNTLQGLERLKSTMQLALSADSTALSLQLKDDIEELSQKFQAHRIDEKSEDIREWLQGIDPSATHMAKKKKRWPKTGAWLFRTKQYTNWLQSSNSLMWIYGIPGSGKTILCSTVIEHLLDYSQTMPRTALAYFYFEFNDVDKGDIASLFKSLITQLSAQCETLPPPLLRLYYDHQSGRKTPTLESLATTLRDMILTFDDIFIVFDALDETLDFEEVLELIQTLHSWGFSRLHVLVTSREIPAIEEALLDIITDRICLQDIKVNQDISIYIKDKFGQDKTFAKWPADLRHQIKMMLVVGEEGMFQWVVCQLDILRKCNSVAAVRKTLTAGLPKSLNSTYDQILLNIDEMDQLDAIKVFKAITAGMVPLSLGDLVEILAVDLEGTPPQFDPDARLLDPRSILSMCSPLVTNIASTWRTAKGWASGALTLELAHASVADYLTNPNPSDYPQFHFTRSSARQFLAQSLLVYLMNPEFSKGYEPLLAKRRMEKYPLLQQCARTWPRCLAKESGDPEDYLEPRTIGILRNFFDTRHIYGGGNYGFWLGLMMPSHAGFIRGTHPLYYASSFGLTDVSRFLLDMEPTLDINELGGRALATALHVGVYRNHIDVVKLLLERGADPSLPNCIGESPLHWAYINGNNEMVKLLKEGGAREKRARHAKGPK